MSTRVVTVDGRFLTMALSGVQRYAHEILRRLPARLESRLRVLVPPDRVLTDPDEFADIEVTETWHGAGGHRWEQVTLPRLVRRAGSDLLWSPCNWGPLAVRRQVLVLHDIAPLTRPEYFTREYTILARLLMAPLLRRLPIVVTPSKSVRRELEQRSPRLSSRTRVIPPGVGPPFDSLPLDDLDRRPGTYCVLVGAHDARKNVDFLLSLWPEVHARTGLELHLTYRRLVTTRQLHDLEARSGQGVVLHADPSDADLAKLYAGALCVVWPSHYEGYGFPLLEAMAVGTPFLATDVGAAAELAVDPDQQILPLDAERWCHRLEEWHARGVRELRTASVERARAMTWDAAADATATLLDELAAT